jgi:membrane glycosyltransferase
VATPPRWRRSLLVWPSLAFAVLVVVLGVSVVGDGADRGPLDWAVLVPFLLIMVWESFVVWQLVLGFAAWARGTNGLSALERRAAAIEPVSTGRSRTALIVPIYEEDAPAIFAALRVMGSSLSRTGRVDDVDVHVLSDTQDPATAADEGREHESLLAWARTAGFELPSFTYRRRTDNAGRKAGNVAEFLRRRADHYDFTIVLDADSLMSGETMRRLIRLMEENPRIGAIQTISYATGRETLFARIQQFAVRLYAPLALRGLEFWQGPDGTYWGHNAILRCAPFRDHCTLPVLSGRLPFGGEILCHDTVEAAMLRRAGWEIHILTEIEGTWEEMPTNVIDLLGRERRWCQGNLQHSRVVGTPGFLWGSRAHLLLGMMGYLTAPIWWAFLLLAALRAVTDGDGQGLGVVAYGLTETGWAATGLVAFAAALILLPRVLNLLRVLGDRRDRQLRRHGAAFPQRRRRAGLLDPARADAVLHQRRLRALDLRGADRALGRAAARRPRRVLGRGDAGARPADGGSASGSPPRRSMSAAGTRSGWRRPRSACSSARRSPCGRAASTSAGCRAAGACS